MASILHKVNLISLNFGQNIIQITLLKTAKKYEKIPIGNRIGRNKPALDAIITGADGSDLPRGFWQQHRRQCPS
jgi:hypothetical protein